MKRHLLLLIAALVVGCSDKPQLRSDVPLTRAQAATKLGFPLPASAHNIYFLFFSGGLQDLESYTRMDVDPQELKSSVEALIADNNKMMSRNLAYAASPLSSFKSVPPRKDFLPMPWWNPDSVKNGYSRGENEGYALQVLVDESLSRIYIYQSD